MEFGGMEWVIIILIVFLLFGAKKIPELARGLGQGLNEFRKAANDMRKEIENSGREEQYQSQPEPQHHDEEQIKSEVPNASGSHP